MAGHGHRGPIAPATTFPPTAWTSARHIADTKRRVVIDATGPVSRRASDELAADAWRLTPRPTGHRSRCSTVARSSPRRPGTRSAATPTVFPTIERLLGTATPRSRRSTASRWRPGRPSPACGSRSRRRRGSRGAGAALVGEHARRLAYPHASSKRRTCPLPRRTRPPLRRDLPGAEPAVGRAARPSSWGRSRSSAARSATTRSSSGRSTPRPRRRSRRSSPKAHSRRRRRASVAPATSPSWAGAGWRRGRKGASARSSRSTSASPRSAASSAQLAPPPQGDVALGLPKRT